MPKIISEQEILKIIDMGFSALGGSVKESLWFYLAQNYGYTRANAVSNLQGLQAALKKFFGAEGYNFLNNLFCQNLSEVTGEKIEATTDFIQYVDEMLIKA
ncbi:MAG: hypothetical protein NWF01_11340 [Candidatus Bathyarchaeota archaeon]|nr:hypothetical protein [Candidatus Bathyarchaeota archaeon]